MALTSRVGLFYVIAAAGLDGAARGSREQHQFGRVQFAERDRGALGMCGFTMKDIMVRMKGVGVVRGEGDVGEVKIAEGTHSTVAGDRVVTEWMLGLSGCR